jgi:hypothetical protein
VSDSFLRSEKGAFLRSTKGARIKDMDVPVMIGTYYSCGGGGVKVYDDDLDEWLALGSIGNGAHCLVIFNGSLYAGLVGGGSNTGVSVYDPGGDSWSAIGSTSQQFRSLFVVDGKLFGLNSLGSTYHIDLSDDSYNLIGDPNTTFNPIYSYVIGGIAYITGDFTSYDSVSSQQGIAFNGTSFISLDGSQRRMANLGETIVIPVGGQAIGGMIENNSGFPVERGYGSWSGSDWTFIGGTEGNYTDPDIPRAYYQGFYNTMLGRRTTGGIDEFTFDGFAVQGTTLNRARYDADGVYAACASNDFNHSTTIIKFDDYGTRLGFKYGDSPPNPCQDILIGIPLDELA